MQSKLRPVESISASKSPDSGAFGLPPFHVRITLLCLGFAGLFSTSIAAAEGDWLSGVRFSLSTGLDDNPLEELAGDTDDGDSFLRIQGEGHLLVPNFGPLRGPNLAVRGFTEGYTAESAEGRSQGEARFRTESILGRSGGRASFEVGLSARDYPDSTARNFERRWIHLGARLKFGPQGTLRPEFHYRTLDYNRTIERDQVGKGIAVNYDWKIRPRLVGTVGLELTGQNYDRASLQSSYTPEGEIELTLGPKQSDNARFLRLNLRYIRRGLFQLQYGLRSQSSNSVGSAFRKHEFRWLMSRPIRWRVSAQFFGTWEATRYRDSDLDEVFILRVGEEQEAADDSNLIAVQLSRPLRSDLRLSARYSWYENESLLIGSFYRKEVATVTLTWEAGRVSSF